MFNAMTNFFTSLTRRFLPDAFIFALLLTIVVFFAGVIFQKQSPLNMISFWGNGFWNLSTFAMQMVLILVTGFSLAKTPVMTRMLKFISSRAKNNTQAVFIVTTISFLACYINWGFGLIVAGLIAIETAKSVKQVNFPLLLASAYSGFLVWHGGLSGSIPLKLTEQNLEIKNLNDISPIGLDQTLFSSFNLTIVICTFIGILFLNLLMSKNQNNVSEFAIDQFESTKIKIHSNLSPSERLENSRLLHFAISLMGIIYIFFIFYKGASVSLDTVIFIFLFSGFIFSKTAKNYLISISDSVKESSGIIIQFPFYAGLMAMMAQSGLAQSMSTFFIEISTAKTFLLNTYLSAGLVNFFVPSGGGQWAIQGPIILPAAQSLGVNLAKASLAIAWGDAWTNMVQPFWVLPLLSLGKAKLGDIMGYCVIIFLTAGFIGSCLFLIMS